MVGGAPLPGHRSVQVLDAAIAIWTAAWLLIGLVVVLELRQLKELGDGAIAAGGALQETANALDRIGGLPIVGDDLQQIEERVRRAGRRTVRGGVRGKREVDRTALLVGGVVVLGPTVPPLLVYLALRRAWMRERRAVREALRGRGAELDSLLAHRALLTLPYRRLQRVSADPARDLAEGRTRALADAELARLGLAGRR